MAQDTLPERQLRLSSVSRKTRLHFQLVFLLAAPTGSAAVPDRTPDYSSPGPVSAMRARKPTKASLSLNSIGAFSRPPLTRA